VPASPQPGTHIDAASSSRTAQLGAGDADSTGVSSVLAPVLPGIELLEELGRGAGSVVFRGVRAGREYAVKVLREQAGGAGFRREAATLARLEHPALPRIYEVGDAAGRPYLVMDLVRGRPFTGSAQTADEATLAALGADVAGALAVAHGAGVVHRDVKPANILVDDTGRARLVDFGLAAATGDTVGDAVAGTLLYAAPEQTGVLHRTVDGRADLYALGAVFFESLAGRPPFLAADPGELVRMHLSAPVPALPASVDPALAAVIGRLLAKDPDDRYLSAAGLEHDLRRISLRDLSDWRVGEADAPTRTDPQMVGRREQRSALLRRWQRGDGGVVLVEGAPGSGKSRLVRELTEAVRAQDGLVLYAKAADDGVPLAPVRQLVDRHVAELKRLPEARRAAACERLRAAAGLTAPMLRVLSAGLADLLGLDDVEVAADEQQFAEAIAGFLTGLGAGGAVLHLDDAQWFDAGTVRLLGRLAAALPSSRLLVVLTARDDPASAAAVDGLAEAVGPALDLRLTVGALDNRAVGDLLTGMLGAATAPTDLIERLVVRSGGNPLAAGEYIRAVADAGLLTPHWGEWRLDTAGLDALDLPTDVLELVSRRADRLGGIHRDLLSVAACCGARFDLAVVAAAAGAEPGTVAAALAEAAGLQLIEAAPDGGMVFLHDRIREALLADLTPETTRELHTRIAVVLEAGGGHEYEIAHHYLAGEVTGDLLPCYLATRAAGLRALADHSPAEAVAFLCRAMDLAAAAGREPGAEAHAALALAASLTGRYAISDVQFAAALAAEPDPLRRARYHRQVAQSFHQRWQPGPAIAAARRGLTELGYELPTGPLRMAACVGRAFAEGLVIGRLPHRRRVVTGRDRAVTAEHSALLAAAAQAHGVAMRLPSVLALGILNQPLVHRLGRGPEYVDLEGGLAIVASAAGLRGPAERMLRRAEQAAASSGDPLTVAHLEWIRGVIHDVCPPMAGGTGAVLRRTTDTFGAAMDSGERLTAYGTLGRILLLRGHVSEAAAVHRRGAATGRADKSLGSVFATLGAEVAAVSGDLAAAAVELAEVRAYADGLAENTPQLINYGLAALHAAVERGDTGAEVDRLIDEFRAQPVRPVLLWSFQKTAWVWIAFARLAQLAAAAPVDRPARLRQTRAALRDLRRHGQGPLLQAWHGAARASLAQLTGDHRGALRRSAALSVRAGGLDLPLLHCELASVRARAWAALLCREDAERAAAEAHTLAMRHGWLTRAVRIRAEFGLAELATGGGGSTPAHTSTLHDNRRLAALQQVSLASASVLEPETLARVALDEIVRIFSAERAFLFLAEDETLRPFLGRNATGEDLSELVGYGSTLVDRVRAGGSALVVTGSDQGVALGSESAVVHGLRSIMVAPLSLKGRLLGVIYLDSRVATGIFTGDDVDLLAAITGHVAVSFDTARVAQLELAVRAAERERDVAGSLRDALAELTASLDPVQVHRVLVRRIAAALPGSSVEVTDEAVPFTDDVRHGVDSGVAWLAAPMRVRGKDQGAIRAVRDGVAFTETEAEVTAALAGLAATAVDNATLFQRTQELATRDGLTGLLNRRHFHEAGDRQIRTEMRFGRPVAAMMLDIDHFKSVNDGHGHAVGDEVIRAVADRLIEVLRESDLVSRYGGEEFAVLLAGPTVEGAASVADRVRAAIADRAVATAAGPLTVTVSIGVAYVTEPGADPGLAAVLELADRALYEAKRAGRNRVRSAPAPSMGAGPGDQAAGLPLATN
jgi:diguanylate cyclase (GGDEF)-like protein